MATFGLRPHEIYACDIIDPFTVRVHEGTKTGERTTRAITPEWSERWNLVNDSQRPKTNVKLLKPVGTTLVRNSNATNYHSLRLTCYRLRSCRDLIRIKFIDKFKHFILVG